MIGACASQSLGPAGCRHPRHQRHPPTPRPRPAPPLSPASGTGAFSAAYTGGLDTTSSSANLGQTNSLHSVDELRTRRRGDRRRVHQLLLRPDEFTGCRRRCLRQRFACPASSPSERPTMSSSTATSATPTAVLLDRPVRAGSSTPSHGLCPYNVAGANDALGLIANNYVEINRPVLASSTNGRARRASCRPAEPVRPPTCDPSDGTNGVTIDAAVLALTQSFVVNNYSVGSAEGQADCLRLHSAIRPRPHRYVPAVAPSPPAT